MGAPTSSVSSWNEVDSRDVRGVSSLRLTRIFFLILTLVPHPALPQLLASTLLLLVTCLGAISKLLNRFSVPEKKRLVTNDTFHFSSFI